MLAIALTLGLAGGVGDAWTDYKPASLAKAFAEAVVVEGSDHTIETSNMKYVVEAFYAGEHRELPTARKNLFRAWAQSLGHPAGYAKLCSHEVRVRAGKEKYWLPLQDALLEPFAQETADGARLRLHIMYVGAVGQERVFVVNRFEVLQQ